MIMCVDLVSKKYRSVCVCTGQYAPAILVTVDESVDQRVVRRVRIRVGHTREGGEGWSGESGGRSE